MDPSALSSIHIRSEPLLNNAKTSFELKAREKAQEFEAVFLNTFVEQMFSGIETDGPFGGGHAEKVYRSMMSQQYAKSIVKSGGVGLADQVYREILAKQHI